jgi:UDP-N-acetylmuramate dehydrogenase
MKQYTALGIGGSPSDLVVCTDGDCVRRALEKAHASGLELLVLGKGSNMILGEDLDNYLVLKIEISGITVVYEDYQSVRIKVGAGVEWDNFVQMACEHGYWGVENLSHIPGTVGAAPVQNIGAYGQEVSSVIHEVIAFDTVLGHEVSLSSTDCNFAYRSSIFNTTEKGRYIILYVEFSLNKTEQPVLEYGALSELKQLGIVTLQDIRDKVIEIRESKFPLPSVVPNVGSFFKNIYVSKDEFYQLRDRLMESHDATRIELAFSKFEDRFAQDNGSIKIPTAFLLDLFGFKGFEMDGFRMNEKQPLIIFRVAEDATVHGLKRLVHHVRSVVQEGTGIYLEVEPDRYGVEL